jgi:chorismate lyase / 3-hydroxybenzoate synthase
LQFNDLGADNLMRTNAGMEEPADTVPAPLRVVYRRLADLPGSAPVLAAVRFGAGVAVPEAALCIDVGLEPLLGPPVAELWHGQGPVRTGREGSVRYAHDDHYLFAVIEEDERAHGGVLPTAEAVYAAIRDFQHQSPYPHLLRMWNYLDAINDGVGDMERYRQFCVGRGRGLGSAYGGPYPAATAIGKQRNDHVMQVFWLAGRIAGTAVENPRQVSAYQYPRVHGPVSPTFSRATRVPDGTVLVSGTASIVGHISRHHDDAMEQLEETVRNLQALPAHAGSKQPDLLKVYLRDPALAQPVEQRLRELYPHSEAIFVAADVCREELLVEIEAIRHC